MKSVTLQSLYVTLFQFAFFTFVAGCGGGADDLPDYAPVSGTVTMGGQPLEGASVTFTPKSGEANVSIGITDNEGKYELMLNRVIGAVVGEHTVRISKREFVDTGEHADGEDPKPAKKKPSAHGHGASGGGGDTTDDGAVQLINEEFSGPSSTLTATVKSGENVFDFEVRGN